MRIAVDFASEPSNEPWQGHQIACGCSGKHGSLHFAAELWYGVGMEWGSRYPARTDEVGLRAPVLQEMSRQCFNT